MAHGSLLCTHSVALEDVADPALVEVSERTEDLRRDPARVPGRELAFPVERLALGVAHGEHEAAARVREDLAQDRERRVLERGQDPRLAEKEVVVALAQR